MMNNSLKKHEQFKEQKKLYTHLNLYAELTATGLDDDSIYYHPKFTLSNNAFIIGQSDLNGHNSKDIYALRFYNKDEFLCDIQDGILDSVIIGWNTNRDVVLCALNSLKLIKSHQNKIEIFMNDFITNLLIGNSAEEEANMIIREVKTVKEFIKSLQITQQ